jgi:hypothetical protein
MEHDPQDRLQDRETNSDDSNGEDLDLFSTMTALATVSRKVDKQFKQILKKLDDRPLGSILSPKPATGKWLQSIGLPHDMISYDHFLKSFFDIYEKEGRLDLATRTLQLRAPEAKLLGLPADVPVTIFRFLGALPHMFS